MKVKIEWEEIWAPFIMSEADATTSYRKEIELPDDLVERYRAAEEAWKRVRSEFRKELKKIDKDHY